MIDRTVESDLDPHHGQQLVWRGYTVLLCNPDGTITEGGRQGLLEHDTRVLSSYQIRLDGASPHVVSSGSLDAASWMARLVVPRSGGHASGPLLPQDVLELTLRRRVGHGMVEEVEIQNHSATGTTTALNIRLAADFCDVIELGSDVQERGAVEYSWKADERTLAIDYHATWNSRMMHRAVRCRLLRADSDPNFSQEKELTFELHLQPRSRWCAKFVYEVLIDEDWLSQIEDAPTLLAQDRVAAGWRRERAHVASHPASAGEAFERAAEDLIELRNWEYDEGAGAWIPNAGIPTYTGLFGRDSLTAGWQAALTGSQIMRGAIARLAMTQAQTDSPWHDAEPGKMVHEVRRGPLSELDIIPQRSYYGTHTASSFFVVMLSELWHWTGDINLLRTYLDAALRTLEWADRYGDRDGDGFLEYDTRSARGLKNQGWKDSDEAIRYPNGDLVPNPIATVEEQAFHWLALQRMAEILLAVGDERRSAEFLARARRLRIEWHKAFWLPDEGFYGMALDPAKRPVRSIGSNPGHALAAGLVPLEHARQVAERLMAPDLFSGWGIRTLSSEHPSYNPLAYHLGTVWPVENATFALGFKRYGFDDYAERLTTAMFDAADHFRRSRLPEALGGHSREQAPIPTVYPASNSPQAWSSSALIQITQTMLGIYPFAPAGIVALVRPRLPEWLSTVSVHNLQVGDARVSIAFERRPDGCTPHRIIDKVGTLHIFEVPPPQDVEHGGLPWQETLAKWLLEHAPGRVASILRLALGDDS
jgi:glycogen debranching enzyme